MNVSPTLPEEVTRFRVTLWPGTPLRLPPTVRMQSELDPTGKAIVPCTQQHEGQTILRRQEFNPSGQTYLRLLEVDLDDADAIIAFVNSYGILDGAWAHASALRELGQYEKVLDRRKEWQTIQRALAATSAGRGERPPPGLFDSYKHRFNHTLSQLRIERGAAQMDNQWLRVAFVETLEEFRFAARCVHDVYWAWRVFNEGVDPGDVGWQSSPDRGFETLGLASTLLTDVLPRLGRIGPQLDVSSGAQAHAQVRPWEPPHETTVELHSSPPSARLYQACAIELYNHIVERATYHHCANEACGRLFVHQEGRAHHGQHRKKGVKYCSPACARSQAQRNYRRRQAGARNANRH